MNIYSLYIFSHFDSLYYVVLQICHEISNDFEKLLDMIFKWPHNNLSYEHIFT